MLITLLLQHALFDELRLFDASGDLLVLLVVAAALTSGPDRGALAGFTIGLVADLVVVSPFGLTVLTYTIVGWLVGSLRMVAVDPRGVHTSITSALAGAASVLLFVGLGVIAGQDQFLERQALTVAAVVAVWALVLGPFAYRLFNWAVADPSTAR
ncbi:MAG: rod shape-determining protein MreD [Actinomycetia bacterium]|nr:rod shape-determining protein MreD [Actinomycetes bacterium]